MEPLDQSKIPGHLVLEGEQNGTYTRGSPQGKRKGIVHERGQGTQGGLHVSNARPPSQHTCRLRQTFPRPADTRPLPNPPTNEPTQTPRRRQSMLQLAGELRREATRQAGSGGAGQTSGGERHRAHGAHRAGMSHHLSTTLPLPASASTRPKQGSVSQIGHLY